MATPVAATPAPVVKTAFDLLAEKQAAKAAEAKKTAYRFTPSSKVENGNLVVSFPISEIGHARQSNGEKGSIGFMCGPIEFSVGGQGLTLRPGWITVGVK